MGGRAGNIQIDTQQQNKEHLLRVKFLINEFDREVGPKLQRI